LADEGMTVFVSSHLLAEIEHVCDHLVMIRGGRSVFQGPVSELRASGGVEIAIRPERADQIAELAHVLTGAGYEVAIDAEGPGAVVRAGSDQAADVNRVAMSAGIALVHLAVRERSLEEAFFALTGTRSADTQHHAALQEVS